MATAASLLPCRHATKAIQCQRGAVAPSDNRRYGPQECLSKGLRRSRRTQDAANWCSDTRRTANTIECENSSNTEPAQPCRRNLPQRDARGCLDRARQGGVLDPVASRQRRPGNTCDQLTLSLTLFWSTTISSDERPESPRGTPRIRGKTQLRSNKCRVGWSSCVDATLQRFAGKVTVAKSWKTLRAASGPPPPCPGWGERDIKAYPFCRTGCREVWNASVSPRWPRPRRP